MSRLVFIDECGYTGEDLFNQHQPIFTLASLYLTEEQCEYLKQKHFSRIKAKELKHSQLARRANQQEMAINFLKDLINEKENVKFAIAHKKYVLVSKMVDLLIENMAHLDGIDFYENGLNIAYSNLLFFTTKAIAGEEFFNKFLENFQIMMRERTIESYHNFFRMFYEEKYPDTLDEIYVLFKAYHHRLGPRAVFALPDNMLNIAFSEAFNLVAEWSKIIKGNWSLVHDNSSNMAKDKDMWEAVTHPEVPPAVVGYDRRQMVFPLRVNDTQFMKSEESSGLQLVDVMAGAMARCLEWAASDERPSDPYAEELFSFLPESFGGHVLWPTPEVTPEELGTIGGRAGDPIGHFEELIKNVRK